ncbi:MAG: drug/metabolite transporter (DMT)-like permease [Arenicella sp.]
MIFVPLLENPKAGFFMAGKFKYYLILHIIVLVWGITGILGDEISVSAEKITFLRTGISFASLLLVGLFIKENKKIELKEMLLLLGTGVIVGLHWYCFFYSIKISTVSIGVVCMSSSTLFTSLLEPLLFKRKVELSEVLLSFAIMIGIVIIFGFETQYAKGIGYGLLSAFFAAFFTVANGRFIKRTSSFKITKFEMLGGFLTLLFILGISGQINSDIISDVRRSDWAYLTILGVVCTTIAFMISVWVMKHVTPFTVSMSINMEPIYTIILALVIAGMRGSTKENMSPGFYGGGLIIIASIFINAYIKKISNSKKKNANRGALDDNEEILA